MGFSLEEIKSAFDAIDVEGRSNIGALDLRRFLSLIGQDSNDSEIDEMIRMFDKDGDGRVAYSEFEKLLREESEIQKESENILEDQYAYERVAAMDGKDRADIFRSTRLEERQRLEIEEEKRYQPVSGNLTKDMQNFIRSLSPNQLLSPKLVKDLLERFKESDEDGNEELDFTEFCKLLDKSHRDPLALRAFELFDTNHSGTVELKELLVGVSAFTEAPVEEKILFALNMFDVNKSQSLDQEQLLSVLKSNFIAQGSLTDAQVAKRLERIFFLASDSAKESKRVSFDELLSIARSNVGLIMPAYHMFQMSN